MRKMKQKNQQIEFPFNRFIGWHGLLNVIANEIDVSARVLRACKLRFMKIQQNYFPPGAPFGKPNNQGLDMLAKEFDAFRLEVKLVERRLADCSAHLFQSVALDIRRYGIDPDDFFED